VAALPAMGSPAPDDTSFYELMLAAAGGGLPVRTSSMTEVQPWLCGG
jgi:hypothetical protein